MMNENDKPRYLRVLIIDDAIDGPFQTCDPAELTQHKGIGEPLSQVTYEYDDLTYVAINSLKAAANFWSIYSDRLCPDIVLTDVNFEKDTTTPLQSVGEFNSSCIPTGLSHCKAFAAIARAKSRPLAIAIHTADPSLWARGAEDRVGNRTKHFFGLLAAHEIIELAALLGDRLSFNTLNLDSVFAWLENRSARGDIRLSKNKGVQLYREAIVSGIIATEDNGSRIRVPYSAALELKLWCERMHESPRPLGSKKGSSDPGLTMLYASGEVDKVYLSSIFADVENIEYSALNKDCFKLQESEGDVWKLRNNLPAIGELVFEVMQSVEVVGEALGYLSDLPLDAEALNRNLRQFENNIAKGIAVLFRAIEIKYQKREEFVRLWLNDMWDPTKLRACKLDDIDDYSNMRPLREWIVCIIKILSKLGDRDGRDRYFEDHDVLGEFRKLLPVASKDEMTIGKLRMHMQLAVEIGAIETIVELESHEYRVVDRAMDIFQSASSPPATLGTREGESVWLSRDVRDSLGFGNKNPDSSHNDNAIGQILYAAFLAGAGKKGVSANQRAKLGRDFFKKFERGEVDVWIRLYCMDFCKNELGWTEKEHWPFQLGK
jgi:hypothetical protein